MKPSPTSPCTPWGGSPEVHFEKIPFHIEEGHGAFLVERPLSVQVAENPFTALRIMMR
jgi:hypothetical protein